MAAIILDSDHISEECGVFGIFSSDHQLKLAPLVYYGLYALQHRGQQSCGIAINDDGFIRCQKGIGLVSEVFSSENLNKMTGQIAIGHVRYSAEKDSDYLSAQPLVSQYAKGTLSISFNGQLTNQEQLREDLEQNGAIFQTNSHGELVLYLLALQRTKTNSIEEALAETIPLLKGSYAFVIMSPRKLLAVRDPWGLKPLCVGKLALDAGYVFSSESCGLDSVGADMIADIKPGQIVVCQQEGLTYLPYQETKKSEICIFEYIYFARPDSVIDGVSVFEARLEAGRLLAREYPVEVDVIIGVPDSGLDAASGYSLESKIPLGRGFIKNSYIGRTFIRPEQSQRLEAVAIKLNPIASVVSGKRVVMVDDSIVRGTTIAKLVMLLKKAGATEVHVRISSPSFLHPCYFGTDVPTSSELIACQHNEQEICGIIGADSLGFLNIKHLPAMIFRQDVNFCQGCFTGEYPEGAI